MENRFAGFGVVGLTLCLTACGQPSTSSSKGAGGAAASSVGGAGGSAGASAGGAGTDAGSAGASPGPGSVACGATSWPEGDQRIYAFDVGGTQREYIVTIPENYDPNHPYRLVFTWHGRGDTAEALAAGFAGSGYYGLAGQIGDSTILVSGQGLGTEDEPEVTGWSNTDGRDIAFVRALLDRLNESYCIDQSRIFSTGLSDGGNLSIAIGCEMSDVFRGIAPMAGALPDAGDAGDAGASCIPGPVAVWQAHGTADEVVTLAEGERARDAYLAANHCDMTAQPVMPEPCVSYDGCDEGYPVVWCAHPAGHARPSFASAYIGLFFGRF